MIDDWETKHSRFTGNLIGHIAHIQVCYSSSYFNFLENIKINQIKWRPHTNIPTKMVDWFPKYDDDDDMKKKKYKSENKNDFDFYYNLLPYTFEYKVFSY